MTISQIDTDKGPVEFSLSGRGKAILVVHGGHIDCRETIFQKGLDHDMFCFITPSRPGYGTTPLTNTNSSPKGTADLLVALLDQLQVQRVTVFGISAGGLTALEIAANYPHRVESVVLMSAVTKKWFNEDDKIYKGGKRIFAPSIEWLTWFLYRSCFTIIPRTMATMMFRELSKHRPVAFTADELKEVRSMTINMRSREGFVNDLDQSLRPDVLAKIDCPVLILHSNNDQAVDLSHADHAKRSIRHSRMITFNNRWGHLLWIGDDYQAVLKEIENHPGVKPGLAN